jgi:hypothetical protein
VVGELISIDIMIVQAFDSAYGDAVETRFLGIMTAGDPAIAAVSGRILVEIAATSVDISDLGIHPAISHRLYVK